MKRRNNLLQRRAAPGQRHWTRNTLRYADRTCCARAKRVNRRRRHARSAAFCPHDPFRTIRKDLAQMVAHNLLRRLATEGVELPRGTRGIQFRTEQMGTAHSCGRMAVGRPGALSRGRHRAGVRRPDSWSRRPSAATQSGNTAVRHCIRSCFAYCYSQRRPSRNKAEHHGRLPHLPGGSIGFCSSSLSGAYSRCGSGTDLDTSLFASPFAAHLSCFLQLAEPRPPTDLIPYLDG
jgi:hypothetical protein